MHFIGLFDRLSELAEIHEESFGTKPNVLWMGFMVYESLIEKAEENAQKKLPAGVKGKVICLSKYRNMVIVPMMEGYGDELAMSHVPNPDLYLMR